MQEKHTISDLYQMQSLPLSAKIRMTELRIRAWVDEYGIDGVYVSFSGGKDSTVLLDIARRLYPDIKAVFIDTGLEYPEIRQFVKQFDNVDWLKPRITFRQVIERYGYPFISKEVSECVYGAKQFLARGGTGSSGGSCAGQGSTRREKYLFEYSKLMGVCQRSTDNNETIWDYCGCFYPEGYLGSDKIFLFNNDQIDRIYALGYQDAEQQEFKKKADHILTELRKQ